MVVSVFGDGEKLSVRWITSWREEGDVDPAARTSGRICFSSSTGGHVGVRDVFVHVLKSFGKTRRFVVSLFW